MSGGSVEADAVEEAAREVLVARTVLLLQYTWAALPPTNNPKGSLQASVVELASTIAELQRRQLPSAELQRQHCRGQLLEVLEVAHSSIFCGRVSGGGGGGGRVSGGGDGGGGGGVRKLPDVDWACLVEAVLTIGSGGSSVEVETLALGLLHDVFGVWGGAAAQHVSGVVEWVSRLYKESNNMGRQAPGSGHRKKNVRGALQQLFVSVLTAGLGRLWVACGTDASTGADAPGNVQLAWKGRSVSTSHGTPLSIVFTQEFCVNDLPGWLALRGNQKNRRNQRNQRLLLNAVRDHARKQAEKAAEQALAQQREAELEQKRFKMCWPSKVRAKGDSLGHDGVEVEPPTPEAAREAADDSLNADWGVLSWGVPSSWLAGGRPRWTGIFSAAGEAEGSITLFAVLPSQPASKPKVKFPGKMEAPNKSVEWSKDAPLLVRVAGVDANLRYQGNNIEIVYDAVPGHILHQRVAEDCDEQLCALLMHTARLGVPGVLGSGSGGNQPFLLASRTRQGARKRQGALVHVRPLPRAPRDANAVLVSVVGLVADAAASLRWGAALGTPTEGPAVVRADKHAKLPDKLAATAAADIMCGDDHSHPDRAAYSLESGGDKLYERVCWLVVSSLYSGQNGFSATVSCDDELLHAMPMAGQALSVPQHQMVNYCARQHKHGGRGGSAGGGAGGGAGAGAGAGGTAKDEDASYMVAIQLIGCRPMDKHTSGYRHAHKVELVLTTTGHPDPENELFEAIFTNGRMSYDGVLNRGAKTALRHDRGGVAAAAAASTPPRGRRQRRRSSRKL